MARIAHLKVKVKTLAAESRIIRLEERKALTAGRRTQKPHHYARYRSLRDHRTGIVRSAARNNQLAYACVRGVPYERVEAFTKAPPNFSEIHKIAIRFGGKPEDVKLWMQAAGTYISESQAQARLTEAA